VASVPLLLNVLSAVGPAAAANAAAARAKNPCGQVASAPHYKHVIWIWMENHSFPTIIGSSSAPFINKLATQCGLATNDHNITHPSLPNYVGATSGLGYAALKRFTSDCNPSAQCSTPARSIFAQGESWKAYEDSMPSDCLPANAGDYAARHNPPLYYSKLAGCAQHDVPYGQLAGDLKRNRLPAFSFITPNLIHDMHNGTVADGDSWLAKNLPAILSSRAYQSRSTVVFLTWDEGEGGSSNRCATNTTDVGCRIATIVISPSTRKGTRSRTLFNHYSLLGTTEQLLHLPKLGRASSFPAMTKAFNL
jgi:phosphatidylinositol-3-phosphatase